MTRTELQEFLDDPREDVGIRVYRVIMKENCSLVAVTSIIMYGYPDWKTYGVPLWMQLGHEDEIAIMAFV